MSLENEAAAKRRPGLSSSVSIVIWLRQFPTGTPVQRFSP
jgi:hypothetical protein